MTVADDWQGRGLGTALLNRLAERARTHEIRRFEAQALSEDRPVLELFKKPGGLELRTHRAVAELVV